VAVARRAATRAASRSTSTSPATAGPAPAWSPRQGGARAHVEEFAGEPVEVEGLLDLRDEGYGFLRVKGYLPSKDDIYVSVKQARQFGLRKGDHITGASRPAMRNEKNPRCCASTRSTASIPSRPAAGPFEDLTPLFPDETLSLEDRDDRAT
jgi:transcription termination factor Rho